MTAILLVIHLILALALIITVLLQRSEGGGLGIGGGSGGGGMMTARGAANLLTRVTAVIAACFMLTSLALALLANNSRRPSSIIDSAPIATPAQPSPAQPTPAAPQGPQVPRGG